MQRDVCDAVGDIVFLRLIALPTLLHASDYVDESCGLRIILFNEYLIGQLVSSIVHSWVL